MLRSPLKCPPLLVFFKNPNSKLALGLPEHRHIFAFVIEYFLILKGKSCNYFPFLSRTILPIMALPLVVTLALSMLSLTHSPWGSSQLNIFFTYIYHLLRFAIVSLATTISLVYLKIHPWGLLGWWKSSSNTTLFLHCHRLHIQTQKISFYYSFKLHKVLEMGFFSNQSPKEAQGTNTTILDPNLCHNSLVVVQSHRTCIIISVGGDTLTFHVNHNYSFASLGIGKKFFISYQLEKDQIR